MLRVPSQIRESTQANRPYSPCLRHCAAEFTRENYDVLQGAKLGGSHGGYENRGIVLGVPKLRIIRFLGYIKATPFFWKYPYGYF